MNQVSGGFNSPTMIPTAKGTARGERGEPEFPPLPPPWTLVPNLPPSASRSGATPSVPSPLLGRGRMGKWAEGRGACGRCPGSLQEGRPAGCSFPSSRRRSVPPRLGLAPRALPSAPGPRPGPGPPPGHQASGPSARSPRPRPASGRGAGVPVPYTRFPAPPAQPLPGPSAAPALRALRPSRLPAGPPPRGPADRAASPSPPSPLPTRAPNPGDTTANGSSPGPGPTCTDQPSLEVEAGNLPPSAVSHWPFRGKS